MKTEDKMLFGVALATVSFAVVVGSISYQAGYEAAQAEHVRQPTQIYELTVRTDKFSSDLVECETLSVECSQPDGGWFRHDFADTKTSYFAPARREKNDD